MQDSEIARKAILEDIGEIAKKIGIDEKYIEKYGKYKAKISLDFYKQKKDKFGKLILVTSINPTPLGEGKTTTSIGLTDALNYIGKKSILVLREPSLGPVFGIKGGATGGGYSQVVPMEDINLHFTGDIHAITSANNLLSAIIDNHIWQGNKLGIKKIVWKRCLDINDRALRKVEVSLSGEKNMIPREDGFDISVASEIMAILCLAEDVKDLKRRLGNIIIGYNNEDKPIRCSDLKAEGSLAVLLKDAIKPNLVQTLEKNPVIIHGGPFANIAHGCNSLISTKLSLKTAEYTITEAGFGADLGAEKFLDIKCRKLKKSPDAVVIVATLRALKYHGGATKDDCINPNEEALKVGMHNLLKHIQNIRKFGLNPIVAINKFDSDTKKEIKILQEMLNGNAEYSILENFTKGGKGAADLAQKIIHICDKSKDFKYIYELNENLNEKIEKIVKNIYGAKGVIYSKQAESQLEKLNNSELPICIAKTQYSFSDNPKDLLCNEPFNIHISEIQLKAGAEFILILAGKIVTMPGLPKRPSAEKINLNEKGLIEGIF